MRINQVAKKYNIKPHTLRYWEKVGVIPIIHRNASGYREYNTLDLESIVATIMMRKAGVNITTLIKMNQLLMKGPKTNPVKKRLLKEQLHEFNDKIKRLTKARNLLAWKVKHWDKLSHSKLYRKVLNQLHYRIYNH